MGDDRDRRRGDDRSERRRSRSRSREGHRSRSRDRERRSSHSRDRDRHRSSRSGSGRDDKRSSRSRSREWRPPPCRSSRSRSRERARYRSRSHERRRGTEGAPRGQSPSRWQHDRFQSTFKLGGRIHEEEEHPGGRRPDHYRQGVGGAQPSARISVYASALMAGFDDDLDAEPYAWEPEVADTLAEPSPVLRITGLPDDAAEADLQALFEPVGGLRDIRVPRDAGSGQCKGYAFMEFESTDAAAALMGSDWREQTFFGEHRMHFEYARSRQEGPVVQDWACELCQYVNFARRAQCYQCQRDRTPGARLVAGPSDLPPSCILRVAGLLPATDEEALRFAFVPHAPVRDIRLVRDRQTGELRGVAYIQFYSTEDAGKALGACQGARLDSQPDRPLQLTYARDRFAGSGVWSAAAPTVAAEAALAHAGWQPKEFGGEGEGGAAGGAGEGEDPMAAWERQQAQEAAAAEAQQPKQAAAAAAQWGAEQGAATSVAAASAAAGPAAAPAAEPEGYDPLAAAAELENSPGASDAAAATAAGYLAQQRAAAEAAGFVFDPSSGYMRDAASGYYFDANTGLYCHPTLQQWGSFDPATGQFLPHDAAAAAAATAAAAAPGFSSAAESALALSSAATYASRHQPPAARHAQRLGLAAQQQHAQQASQPQRPRRGAVIGAAAQLDSRGLMEAARREEEKLQLMRKQQELEEAKQKRVAARQAARQQRQGGGAAASGAAAGTGGAPVGGIVHGIVHESSWAASRRQQQQQ